MQCALLKIDGIPAEIILRRSRRVTMSVSITALGEVKVNAPLKLSLKKIENFIIDRRPWIISHLQSADNKLSVAKDFTELSKFMLNGEVYEILRKQIKKADIDNKLLYLPLTTENQDTSDIKNIRIFLKHEAEKSLSYLLKDLAEKTKISYNSFKLTDSKKCWGMCGADKTIKLNLRLAILPESLKKYVVIHELCHILELNHSPNFWKKVESFLPNYKDLKKELNKYSAFMYLYR